MRATAAIVPQVPHWVARRPLTVSEYHRMGEIGILGEDDRVELIDGELIAMSPIGSNHSGTVNAVTRALIQSVGQQGVVSVQNPIQLDEHSEPQPDFSVLKPRPDDYRSQTPRPEDVLLVIEVADSSLRYDRTVKMHLYARHKIPELWIVDLPAGKVDICRAPDGDTYTSIERAGHEQSVELFGLPGVIIPMAAVLG